jgi:hypothetical protein
MVKLLCVISEKECCRKRLVRIVKNLYTLLFQQFRGRAKENHKKVSHNV